MRGAGGDATMSVDPQGVNILQATQAACMPTFAAASQGVASCKDFATLMDAFFAGSNPDLVIISADWGEYARGSRFDGMIADMDLARMDRVLE